MKQSPKQLLAEVAGAGYCRHPIRLYGETVNTVTGELRNQQLHLPCKDRRAAVCPSCSYLYKADAWILVLAGLVGGKGLPESVAGHPRLFVTLTAPSFGAVHTKTSTGACHPGEPTCVHAQPCLTRHDDHDPLLGTAICAECFDYEGAVLWNAACSKLWNRTVDWLRHRLAASQGLSISKFRKVAELSYLRVAELQRRGLVHLHVVLRCDGPEGPASSPPEWLTAELVTRELLRVLDDLDMPTVARSVRWGTQRDVVDLMGEPDSARVASYVAKYATKGADGSMGLAMRFRSREHVERARTDEHHRRIALTAWDLGEREEVETLRLRDHAHELGFTGQLLTKSRRFSTTFGALRGARTAFMATEHGDEPLLGTFGFVGRGYSDHRAEAVAEMLHELTVQLHQDRKARRLEEAGEGSGGGM